MFYRVQKGVKKGAPAGSVSGCGGGRKAASAHGSKSWEKFLKENPDRELKR